MPSPFFWGSALSLVFASISIGGAPAGNIESRSGRERTFFAGKPANQRGAFHGFAQPAHGNLGLHIVYLTFRQLREDSAFEGRGRYAIHQDALGGELLAEALGE